MRKVLIATGNEDKYRRMTRWLKGLDVRVHSFNDFEESFAKRAKLTSDEERRFPTMNERAIAKVQRAAGAIASTKTDDYYIIALDDTAYFPILDTEIVDLRIPPAIYKGGKLVIEAATERLQGKDLANFYAEMVLKLVDTTEEMKSLGYQYMPIIWKFALALGKSSASNETRVICHWEHKEYMRGIPVREEVTDNGYMLDLITSHKIDGPVNRHNPTIWDEKEPTEALSKHLK